MRVFSSLTVTVSAQLTNYELWVDKKWTITHWTTVSPLFHESSFNMYLSSANLLYYSLFGIWCPCRDTRPGGVMTSSSGSPPIWTLWTFASRSPKSVEKGKLLLPWRRSAWWIISTFHFVTHWSTWRHPHTHIHVYSCYVCLCQKHALNQRNTLNFFDINLFFATQSFSLISFLPWGSIPPNVTLLQCAKVHSFNHNFLHALSNPRILYLYWILYLYRHICFMCLYTKK